MKQLYKEIWESRTHRCTVCGYPITHPVANVFSHVYSKGAHPSLKYDKRNIELWCSTIIRRDRERGCHELSHTNPEAFNKRANYHNYKKPDLLELKTKTEAV